MSGKKTVSSNETVSNKTLSNETLSNKTLSSETMSNESLSSVGNWGNTSGNGGNSVVVVLGTSMDWDWVGHCNRLCVGNLDWYSYWLGNGSGYLDLIDLSIGVFDDGTGMEGSINKVGDILLYLDFLDLDCDFWGMMGHLGEEDRGRSNGRGRERRLVDGGGGTSNVGLCAVVGLLVDGDCHMLLGEWNLDFLRWQSNSILLWSGLDNVVSYANLGSGVSDSVRDSTN